MKSERTRGYTDISLNPKFPEHTITILQNSGNLPRIARITLVNIAEIANAKTRCADCPLPRNNLAGQTTCTGTQDDGSADLNEGTVGRWNDPRERRLNYVRCSATIGVIYPLIKNLENQQ